MSDNEGLSDHDHLRTEVDAFFVGNTYADPLEYGGANLVATRSRDRYGVDPANGQRLSATDKLWVNDASTPDNPANLTTSRIIYLRRGDDEEQFFINFHFDTGEISVTGNAKDSFTGDPKEELLAGLRIIAENETGPA